MALGLINPNPNHISSCHRHYYCYLNCLSKSVVCMVHLILCIYYPSLVLLGALKSNQMTDHAHGNGYVTTLNVLDCSVGQECSHGRRCYVAVGFSSGTVSVIRLGRQSGERYSSWQPDWYPHLGSLPLHLSLSLPLTFSLCVCVSSF